MMTQSRILLYPTVMMILLMIVGLLNHAKGQDLSGEDVNPDGTQRRARSVLSGLMGGTTEPGADETRKSRQGSQSSTCAQTSQQAGCYCTANANCGGTNLCCNGVCCSSGEVCVNNNVCCPIAQTCANCNCSNTICCPSGFNCANNECCIAANVCAAGVFDATPVCCIPPSSCNGGICCTQARICNGICCPPDKMCCPPGSGGGTTGTCKSPSSC